MPGWHPNRAAKAAADIESRFWPKVRKTKTCWLWTDAIDSLGYARFPHTSAEGKPVVHLAHRLAWELVRGPIPDGANLIHLCGVRHCVNPDHLEVVTVKQNVTGESSTLLA